MNALDTVRAQIEAHLLRNLRPESRPAALHLRCLQFGHDQESLADVPSEALDPEDVPMLAGELAGAAVDRAAEAQRPMRFAIEASGDGASSFPIFRFVVRPDPAEVPAPTDGRALASRRSSDDVVLAEEEGDGPAAFLGEHRGEMIARPPPVSSQAAALAAFSLRSMSDMQDLVVRSAAQREDGFMKEIDRLRAEVRHYSEAHTAVIFEREQLLDRSLDRKMKADRQRENDAALRQLAQRLFGIAILHAPQVAEKLGKELSPEQQAVLLDLARAAATTPAGSALSSLANGVQGVMSSTKSSNGSAAKVGGATHATAGDLAAATCTTPDGVTVGAGAAFVFAALTTKFLASLRAKLPLVRGALDEKQAALLDNILEIADQHGSAFTKVAAATAAGTMRAAPARKLEEPPGNPDEDAKLMKLIDLSGAFWAELTDEAAVAMCQVISPRAAEIVTTVRREFNFAALKASAN